ncbi:hypothetical protein ACFL7E_04005 [Thermodesulfobacteriota bacterium]
MRSKTEHHGSTRGWEKFFIGTQRAYDVITIDPAPPIYSAGTVNLYTREFLELCKAGFLKYVKSMGVTHILARIDLIDKYLTDNFPKDDIEQLLNLIKMHWKVMYESGGYVVWDVQA